MNPLAQERVQAQVQVQVLGGVSAEEQGSPVSLGGAMQRRLLAVLVASHPKAMRLDALPDQLWPSGGAAADPNRTIRNYVARLRAILGQEAIRTGPGGYAMGEIDVDAHRFENLVTRARRATDSLVAVELWTDALALWHGPAFDGFQDIAAVLPVAERLDEMRVEAKEALFDARLAGGEGRELAADVQTEVSEHPLRERFRAQQMTVLTVMGRRPEALRAFQQFRAELTELGLEPSDDLVALDASIAAGDDLRAVADRQVRGYEVGERLGEGAFSIVYRASQPSVGRDVAIKQIRSELANRPEFIVQFEAEAHLVARLEHPQIVPLYDFWREPGSAYLVMRYLRGGSLAQAVADQPMELEAAVVMAGQIAEALDEAHRHGVVHRDVKPANILLDDTGRAFLSDFGIAVDEVEALGPQAWLSNGSPAYASPEQLRRDAVGSSADIFSLGVTVFEALTGQVPFPEETSMAALLERQLNDPIPLARTRRPELPAAVDTVLQRATAKQPAARYESASAFAASLTAAAGLAGAVPRPPQDRNPYKGLRAFTEADAGDFAGRERLVDRLLTAVGSTPLTLVVGPSGSGKSSVVQAGLLPAIRQGRITGSGSWFVTSLTPSDDPFAGLEEALLRVAVEPPPDLAERLRSDRRELGRLARRIVPSGRTLLVVIDQLEELFTLSASVEQQRFVQMLVTASTDSSTPIRIVATIRADFYDRPLRYPDFASLIEQATVTVPPLAADELERAITEPAAGAGVVFEPGLVARITAEVADEPGALPFLEYLLTELYDRRDGSVLTRRTFDELGGVSGSLGRRAEETFCSLPSAEQEAATRLFTRLVNLGDGAEDTRRRIRHAELPAGRAYETVLTTFGSARLLSFDHEVTTREPMVQVAHESLIGAWPRLHRWLESNRDGLRTMRHMGEAATSWDGRGRDEGDLYRGRRLEAASEWAHGHCRDLNELERAFLAASEARERAEEQAEQESKRRLRGLVEQERLANTKLRRALIVVAMAAILAVGAGVIARQRGQQAAEQRREAEIAALVATSLQLVESDPVLAGLLAVEAHAHDQRAAAPALYAALAASPGLQQSIEWGGPPGASSCGRIAPAGTAVIAQASTAGPVRLITENGDIREVGSGVLCRAALSPDGRLIAGVVDSGDLVVWNADSERVMARGPLGPGINAVEWSPDSTALAIIHNAIDAGFERGANLELFDAATAQPIWEAPTDIARPFSVVWSPDGERLIVGSESAGFPVSLSVVDVQQQQVLRSVETGPDRIGWLSISPDGTAAVTVTPTGDVTVRATDNLTSALKLVPARFPGRAVRAWFLSDGTTLAVGSLDGTLSFVDASTGEAVRRPLVLDSVAADFNHTEGGEIRVLDESGTLSTYDLEQAGPSLEVVAVPERPVRNQGSVRDGVADERASSNISLTPTPDGTGALLASSEQQVYRIDLRTREVTPLRTGLFRTNTTWHHVGLPDGVVGTYMGAVNGAFVAHDRQGQLVVELDLDAGFDRPVTVFEVAANEGGAVAMLGRLHAPGAIVERGTLSTEGTDFAFLIDPAALTLEYTAVPDGVLAETIWLTDDDIAVVGLADGRLGFVEPGIGYRPGPVIDPGSPIRALAQHNEVVIAVSASGRMFAVTGEHVELVTAVASDVVDIRTIGWAPQAVTTDNQGTMQLWDLETGTELGVLRSGPGYADAYPVVDPDRQVVWVPGRQTLDAVATDPSGWASELCQRTQRRLTTAERVAYLPRGLLADGPTTC